MTKFKLEMDSDVSDIVFTMTERSGTEEEQQVQFVDFFLGVEDFIRQLKDGTITAEDKEPIRCNELEEK